MINNFRFPKHIFLFLIILVIFGIIAFFHFENTSAINTNAFITTWQTDPLDNTHSITIPTFAGETYNYLVDWGDESSSEYIDDVPPTHLYDIDGTYTVTITGTFPRIYFAGNDVEALKIISVDNWGTRISWSSMESAFFNCANLVINATDSPDLSNVTDTSYMFFGATSLTSVNSRWTVSTITNMSHMFAQASSFNDADIGGWDVSNVTDMSNLFEWATSFNGDISAWDISNVTNMDHMFSNATNFNNNGQLLDWGTKIANVTNMRYMFHNTDAFNIDIRDWNTLNVITMHDMFSGTAIFNQDISSWVTSNVTDMSSMFSNSLAFNQDVSSWDVSKVTTMESMFNTASAFNNGGQVLDWINTSLVTNMSYMFSNATSFNQDISSWDVSNVTTMEDMFLNITISTTNYDLILNAWSELNLKSDVKFNAGNSYYCATTQRSNIINSFTWIITDLGLSNCHTVTYVEGTGGTITGTLSQTVAHGSDATSVRAVANSGYQFVNWTGTNTLTDASITNTNVTEDITETANFELIPETPPETPPVVNNHTSSGSYLPGYGPKVLDTKPILEIPKKCSPLETLTQNLKIGSRNGKYNSFAGEIVKEVKILQSHLNRLDFPVGKVDGVIGFVTDASIRRMQKYFGIKADGLVGFITRGFINNSCGEN
ncbi:MAG: BspA family leucine-rich repeat surface protein [Candidatus Nomurabacteria bacterium]|nr:BspA family leucine-rich repeat surface protein [Candidatus Nomurabacteria bacterium]